MDNRNFQQTIDLNELPKIRNGAAWYVCVLPALAGFLESYAINKWLGMMLWAFVLIACPVICYKDQKNLERMGIYMPPMKKTAVFFPIAYQFQRCKVLRQSNLKAVLFAAFTGFALIGNGFTVSLGMDDSAFIDRVKYNYVANLDDFSGDSTFNIIGKQLDAFSVKDSVKYVIETDGDWHYVTSKGTFDDAGKNTPFEITFGLEYDGYAFKSFEIEAVSVGGKKIAGDERKKFLNKIFIETKAEDDSSNAEVNSSDENNSYVQA